MRFSKGLIPLVTDSVNTIRSKGKSPGCLQPPRPFPLLPEGFFVFFQWISGIFHHRKWKTKSKTKTEMEKFLWQRRVIHENVEKWQSQRGLARGRRYLGERRSTPSECTPHSEGVLFEMTVTTHCTPSLTNSVSNVRTLKSDFDKFRSCSRRKWGLTLGFTCPTEGNSNQNI